MVDALYHELQASGSRTWTGVVPFRFDAFGFAPAFKDRDALTLSPLATACSSS